MRDIPVERPLACPRDGAPLRPFRIGELEVDTCLTCSGTWLDAAELGGLAHDKELEAIVLAATAPATSPFACPRCAGVCHPARVEGVELDACERCGGIWMDAQELGDARTRVLARRAGLASVARAAAAKRA